MQKIWSQLEKSFPNWEIHHTGGGNFVIRKNFSDIYGNEVMVALSDIVALIMKDANNNKRYISHSEFLENEDIYWEKAFHLEELVLTIENRLIKETESSKIFNPETIKELSNNIQTMNNIIWNDSEWKKQ